MCGSATRSRSNSATDEFAAFAARYGLDAPPNFEGHSWHLHVARPLADVAARLGRDEAACAALIADARARLFALREARDRPGRDDKVLTSWNALAIDGMAFAARVFDRATLGRRRRVAPRTSFAPRCGARGACWPQARRPLAPQCLSR